MLTEAQRKIMAIIGKAGGIARAKKLSKQRRREIAQMAGSALKRPRRNGAKRP